MRTRYAAVALAAGTLAAACSGNSLTPPTPTASPSASASASPSSSPSVSSRLVALRTGVAGVKTTGGLSAHLSLPLAPPGGSFWGAASGEITLKYLTRDGDALLLNGTIAGKSARTSTSLTLSFVIREKKGPVAFSSSNGECKVTLTRAPEKRVQGRYSCSKLHSLGAGKRTVDATGTFQGAH